MTIPQIAMEFNALAEDEGYVLDCQELCATMSLLAPDPGGMYPSVSLRMGAIQCAYLYELWTAPVDTIIHNLTSPDQIVRVLTKYRLIHEERHD